jgi:YegS/Rv2252/BmrU family lipid kinase
LKSTLFIVNPAAGAGRTARAWPVLRSKLDATGLQFDAAFTSSPGHATSLAREAVLAGYEMIVAVGGDGTVNEVVNGLCLEGGERNVTLGIISTGTGSDLVRTLGIPRVPFEAARILLSPKKKAIDIGLAEFVRGGQIIRRFFVNFAGVGIDAEIVRATAERFKKLGSKPAYICGLMATMLSYRNVETTIVLDGVSQSKMVCEVLVSNGKYGGGSMLAAPEADLSDGWLDVMTIKEMSRPELLCCFPTIYKGTHIYNPKVEMKRVKEIEIRPVVPLPLQADGELLGETPVKIRIIPKMINVAV